MTHSIKNVLLPDPTVQLVFEGLLWFIFHDSEECQIGIHNTTQGTSVPHDHPHFLEIDVWTIESGCGTSAKVCGRPEKISIGNPKTISSIQINASMPKENGVQVYQKDPFDRLNNDASDPKDWRWVFDFEKDPFYPKGIKLHPEKINPSISINNGLFYTLHKTSSTFELLPLGGTGSQKVGNAVHFVGGNIYLKEGGEVTLTIRRPAPVPPTVKHLTLKDGVCYQIDIRNVCKKNHQPCAFTPDDPVIEERNDFYLYYETFTKPSDRPVYTLKLDTPGPAGDFPPEICLETDVVERIESSKDSPCGSVTAGGGGG